MLNPLMINISFFNKTKSTNLTFLILMSSIALNMFMFLYSSNKWFPLMLTLLFSGSMMILFSFVASTSPNTKTPKYPLFLIPSIPILLTLSTSSKQIINLSLPSNSLLYSSEDPSYLMIVALLCLIVESLKSQITNSSTPLKSTM